MELFEKLGKQFPGVSFACVVSEKGTWHISIPLESIKKLKAPTSSLSDEGIEKMVRAAKKDASTSFVTLPQEPTEDTDKKEEGPFFAPLAKPHPLSVEAAFQRQVEENWRRTQEEEEAAKAAEAPQVPPPFSSEAFFQRELAEAFTRQQEEAEATAKAAEAPPSPPPYSADGVHQTYLAEIVARQQEEAETPALLTIKRQRTGSPLPQEPLPPEEMPG